MGCASSKRIEDAIVVYRPPPSSFAVFDVNSIEEPWLKGGGAAAAAESDSEEEEEEKQSHVPAPILEKLNAIEGAPRSWDEVSKALEDFKAAPPPPTAPVSSPKKSPAAPPANDSPAAARRKLPRKSFSFHTLEELEAKPTTTKPTESKRVDSPWNHELKRFNSARTESLAESTKNGEAVVPKSLRENIFILKDKMEREKGGKAGGGFVRPDPLADFEENCPPGGGDAVVVYTTSLRGVRRTHEDCQRVRQLMETHQVVFDERDVAMDGGFLTELRELLGEGAAAAAAVPRVFVKGRYVGGVEEVVGLNETGRLSRILNWAKVERGAGRVGCAGCGGARFVPCLECGGSCKVVVEGKKERERCGVCNENGLVHCPICI